MEEVKVETPVQTPAPVQEPVEDIVHHDYKIHGPTNELKKKLFVIAVIGTIFIALGGMFTYAYVSSNSASPSPSPTATPAPKQIAPADPTANWQVSKPNISTSNKFYPYAYSVKVPAEWTPVPHSSNFEETTGFKSADNLLFDIVLIENKKPYKTIDEFIDLPASVKKVKVGGLDARQPLPRGGSENVYEADFFSQDSKIIYRVKFTYPLDSLEPDIYKRQEFFDLLLSNFKLEKTPSTLGACIPSGCSNQFCVDSVLEDPVVTTCEYLTSYACTALTKCERQPSGSCGWTPNAKYNQCLMQP